MRTCRNCGSRFEEEKDLNFCPACGAPLTAGNKYTGLIIGGCAVIIIAVIIVVMIMKPWDTGSTAYEEGSGDYGDIYEETYEEDDALYEGDADGYLLPESDREYLTESDLAVLTDEELRLARNEIFARKGRLFDDPGLQSYFDSRSWYSGTVSPEDFSKDMLSEVEKENIELIQAEEKSR